MYFETAPSGGAFLLVLNIVFWVRTVRKLKTNYLVASIACLMAPCVRIVSAIRVNSKSVLCKIQSVYSHWP